MVKLSCSTLVTRHFETGEDFCAAQTQRQERQADEQTGTTFPEQVAKLAVIQVGFYAK
jgi:hypothetical protein